ncbi:hypothetical protein ID866_4493 [Astraeus odoratus]|nr:hypothetical protein ID866_4493 [Astraeus odoratus]
MEPIYTDSPTTFTLPDLHAICTYPFRVHPKLNEVSRASEKWLSDLGDLDEAWTSRFKAAKLTALVAGYHPDADLDRFRVFTDYIHWAVLVDDWLDYYHQGDARALRECCMRAFRDPDFVTEDRSALMIKSFFGRFLQTSGPGCTKRFVEGMDLFFIATEREAEYRDKRCIADLESYLAYRRDTGGCMPLFALIEYINGIDLPEEVVSHPVIQAMESAANDVICWANDIYSYNAEQARGDNHNLISVLMHEKGLDVQEAMNEAGAIWCAGFQCFEDNIDYLPSWGEDVDRLVAIYTQGLRNHITSLLHWSFYTERYFGQDGPQIKKDRIVRLCPKQAI